MCERINPYFYGQQRSDNIEKHTISRDMGRRMTNLTVVTDFFLLGFQGSQSLRFLLFLLFLIIYNLTLCGNLLIITLVSSSRTLQTPMYFFISQLSISDILLTTTIVPNLLHVLLNNGRFITFVGCFAQFYFFCISEGFECLLLTVMSYDRYVAICKPLRYTSIITNEICVKSVSICWLLGLFMSFVLTITPSKLYFCGLNIIDHLFCDIVPFLELSCSDPYIVHLEIYIMGTPVLLISVTTIVLSYTCIVRAVLRIPSSTGRQKAFSTCSSHLIVVSIFYWTLFCVYILPTRGQTSAMSKILSLLYTVFTPLINPIIYSLRNKDIKKSIEEAYTSYLGISHFPIPSTKPETGCLVIQEVISLFLVQKGHELGSYSLAYTLLMNDQGPQQLTIGELYSMLSSLKKAILAENVYFVFTKPCTNLQILKQSRKRSIVCRFETSS
ncbi:olfactory receptor 8H1-like [Leptodactylus fuscus]|uniref:olfactory receptor 8H1-like n=1 Tax=Leptodactylus fuscus TaxID=238119 RepID=UPI003F4E66D1